MSEYREPRRVKVAKILSWLPTAFVGMGLSVGVASGADLAVALALPVGLYGGAAIMRHAVRTGRFQPKA
ncbi:hypothetical protein AAC691_17150 [Nguyenibacter vanlangensis]|uniref:Uncharacterized protein n=1 Tax=Nguyenibacter vanlangensis TaxID=1216886 RepID=A0ABZ3D2V6_9PROT